MSPSRTAQTRSFVCIGVGWAASTSRFWRPRRVVTRISAVLMYGYVQLHFFRMTDKPSGVYLLIFAGIFRPNWRESTSHQVSGGTGRGHFVNLRGDGWAERIYVPDFWELWLRPLGASIRSLVEGDHLAHWWRIVVVALDHHHRTFGAKFHSLGFSCLPTDLRVSVRVFNPFLGSPFNHQSSRWRKPVILALPTAGPIHELFSRLLITFWIAVSGRGALGCSH